MKGKREPTVEEICAEEERAPYVCQSALQRLFGPNWMSNNYSSLVMMCQGVPGEVAARWTDALRTARRND